jgi:hypothetical protein
VQTSDWVSKDLDDLSIIEGASTGRGIAIDARRLSHMKPNCHHLRAAMGRDQCPLQRKSRRRANEKPDMVSKRHVRYWHFSDMPPAPPNGKADTPDPLSNVS